LTARIHFSTLDARRVFVMVKFISSMVIYYSRDRGRSCSAIEREREGASGGEDAMRVGDVFWEKIRMRRCVLKMKI
jgi:hypothetical protein